jgi:hypothetical protein
MVVTSGVYNTAAVNGEFHTSTSIGVVVFLSFPGKCRYIP